METNAPVTDRKTTLVEKIQSGLFWSWNLIFLAFMSLGFGPRILPETLTAVRTGMIPAAYLLYALMLTLIPVVAVLLGLTVLRRSPGRLFALGYVIEGPLMLMLAVRFFLIRQATPGTSLLIVITLLGMAGFFWYLLDRRSGSRSTLVEALRIAGLTLMAVVSLYAAAWLAFYALPLGVLGGRALGDLLANLSTVLRDIGRGLLQTLKESPLMLPFSLLGFILVIYTGTLFVVAPIAVPFLSVRAWLRSLRQQADRGGRLMPALLVSGVIAASALAFVLMNRQPQAQAFALLAKTPTKMEEVQSLLEKSEVIRAGLLNAYLAPYRYISSEGEVVHIRDIYADIFDMLPSDAYAVERVYEGFASPLLYKPVHAPDKLSQADNRAFSVEPQEAARLYQGFFDEPISVAERQTIVRAVRSTWSFDQAEAAWQAVDDREVRLVRQEVSLREQGDWADFELLEAYQNQTVSNQEVIYYFNLPESAVLTGVWLGNTPDKATAFRFQVAPRGAAQAVYRESTRVNIDPALLEQIGPRQYRLRVFPIPVMRTTYDPYNSRTMVEEAPLFYMWLSWRGMADRDAWPMPRLALLNNVYWDAKTERVLNGQPLKAAADEWLPESLPASSPVAAQVHQVDLPGGQTVLAIPASSLPAPRLPSGLRIAMVVDRSRSMQAHSDQVTAALQQIKTIEGVEEPVDVYLTASPYRGEAPSVVELDSLNLADIIFFGGQNAGQLIAQFEALHASDRSSRIYDAVFVLTDGSGYEMGAGEVQVAVPDSPVWMVHLGAEIPLGYDDPTLQAIQASGGGLTGNLDDALKRLAVSLQAKAEAGGDTAQVDLVDGYYWTVLPIAQASAAIPAGAQVQIHQANEPFAALAARRVLLAEMQRQRGTITQLETLDALHALAMQYEIVTPYSSMIVVVTSGQQAMLDRFSNLDDRYQREVEGLGKTTPNSPVPLAGVPEPHEWLLLGMAAAFLVYLGYRRRSLAFQTVPSSHRLVG